MAVIRRFTWYSILGFSLSTSHAIFPAFSNPGISSHASILKRKLGFQAPNTMSCSSYATTKLNYAQTTLPDTSDPYVILNLDPASVDLKEIKKAYRKMALKYHPDVRAAVDRDIANEEFARVNAAYAYLTGKSDDAPVSSTSKSTSTTGGANHSTSANSYDTNSNRNPFTRNTATTTTTTNWNTNTNRNTNAHQQHHHYSHHNSHQNNHNDFYRKVKINHDYHNQDSWHQTNSGNYDHGSAVGNRSASYESSHASSFHSPSPNYQSHPSSSQDEERRACESQGRPFTYTQTSNHDTSFHASSSSSDWNPPFKSSKKPHTSAHIWDFAQRAQVRNFDMHGNPIDSEPSKSSTAYTYSTTTNHNVNDSERNDSPKNTETSTTYSNTFVRDFASHAQVRDYDSNGNPIHTESHSAHYGHAYRAMHTHMKSEAFDKATAQRDLYDAFAKAGYQTHSVSTPSADNVVSFDIHGNPVQRKYDPTTYSATSQSKYDAELNRPSAANVQAYDIHGNPVNRAAATNMYHGWSESENISWSAPYSYAPNMNKDASSVSWSDTVVDTTSYASHSHTHSTEPGTTAPSANRVQAYDIYGNPVDRRVHPAYTREYSNTATSHASTSATKEIENQSSGASSGSQNEYDFAAFCKNPNAFRNPSPSSTISNGNSINFEDTIDDTSNLSVNDNFNLLRNVIEKVEHLITNQGVRYPHEKEACP